MMSDECIWLQHGLSFHWEPRGNVHLTVGALAPHKYAACCMLQAIVDDMRADIAQARALLQQLKMQAATQAS